MFIKTSVLAILLFIFSTIGANAHEDISNTPIDCSTEIISAPMLEDGGVVYKAQRRTNFAIPVNFLKQHYDIPQIEGWGHYQLSVVAVGKGDYKFKDTVSIPIKNEDGKLRVIDPFGVPWKVVPDEEIGKQISDVECYMVN